MILRNIITAAIALLLVACTHVANINASYEKCFDSWDKPVEYSQCAVNAVDNTQADMSLQPHLIRYRESMVALHEELQSKKKLNVKKAQAQIADLNSQLQLDTMEEERKAEQQIAAVAIVATTGAVVAYAANPNNNLGGGGRSSYQGEYCPPLTGCCSGHNGVQTTYNGYVVSSFGNVMCNDGMASPSCTIDHECKLRSY